MYGIILAARRGVNARRAILVGAVVFALKKILSALILPPLGPLLAIALGLLLWRRLPRLGRWLAWCGTLALTALSMPLVGHMLLASTERAPPLHLPLAQQAQAIVVLGGGTYYSAPEYGGDTVGRYALERLRYAARLARQVKLPLLVSGGAPFGGTAEALLMKAVLENDFGVAVRWTESSSADTHDNALNSASILHKAGMRRVVLVTHAWHMRRAQAEFAQAGLDTLPAPTGFSTLAPQSWDDLLPSARGLEDSRSALREWLGRWVAELRPIPFPDHL